MATTPPDGSRTYVLSLGLQAWQIAQTTTAMRMAAATMPAKILANGCCGEQCRHSSLATTKGPILTGLRENLCARPSPSNNSLSQNGEEWRRTGAIPPTPPEVPALDVKNTTSCLTQHLLSGTGAHPPYHFYRECREVPAVRAALHIISSRE